MALRDLQLLARIGHAAASAERLTGRPAAADLAPAVVRREGLGRVTEGRRRLVVPALDQETNGLAFGHRGKVLAMEAACRRPERAGIRAEIGRGPVVCRSEE